jgi:hypothetical protein
VLRLDCVWLFLVGPVVGMSRVFKRHASEDSRAAVALKDWLGKQEPQLVNEIFLDIDPSMTSCETTCIAAVQGIVRRHVIRRPTTAAAGVVSSCLKMNVIASTKPTAVLAGYT